MAQRFNRIAQVIVQRLKPTATEQRFFIPLPDPVLIQDLQIKFTVEQNLSSKPNTCEIQVTNLSSSSRTEVARDGLYVRLLAGHDNAPRHLFAGNVTWSNSIPDGTEWFTKIQVGDGATAIQEAFVNKSYNPGVQVITILRDAAKSMGLVLPTELEVSKELRAQFAAGFVFSDYTREELTRLLAPFGYRWSVLNGRLLVLKDSQTDGEAILVSEDTGLIRSPEFGKPEKGKTQPKLSAKMLLTPEIKPGCLVELRSRTVNGFFKCQRSAHKGDTHNVDEWVTEMELKPR